MIARCSDLTIRTKLICHAVIFLLGFGIFALVFFNRLNEVKVTGPLYAGIMRDTDLIADIVPPPMYIIESYLNVLEILNETESGRDEEYLKGLTAKAKELRKEYEERHAFWMNKFPEGQIKQALLASYYPAMEFYEARDREFLPAIIAGDIKKVKAVTEAVLHPKYEAHHAIIHRVVALAIGHARQDEKDAAEDITKTMIFLVVMGFSIAGISLLLSVFLSRSITVPLARVAGVARDIAEGKLDTTQLCEITSKNEIGALAQAFAYMTRRLSENIGRLRASEEKYRIVADNTFDCEFWRNTEGQYIYISPSCQRITGYKTADFEADPDLLINLIHPDDQPVMADHQNRIKSRLTVAPSSMEFRITAADGTERWINHACFPIFDKAGAYLGTRGSNRDITLRKKAEAELIIAKERAEAATRAKNAFLSNISHELRTPLNAIMGYTEILKRQQNLTGVQLQQLDVLHDNSEHLLTLINTILEASKNGVGKVLLEKALFNLPALLQRVSESTATQAEDKKLVFRYEPLTPLPECVQGDAYRLKQALLNLLNNAVRYTNRGEITLRVWYHESSQLFLCEVSDTGKGIPADKIETIFEPFTQLSREGRVTEGTGLGLTITKQLVTLMHGKIDVKSELGKGSTFRLEVPLSKIKEDGGLEGIPAGASVAADATTEDLQTIPMPPQEEMVELYQLAMLGDMRKILAWAARLEEKDKGYGKFAEKVAELAKGFKAKAIAALVEEQFGGKVPNVRLH